MNLSEFRDHIIHIEKEKRSKKRKLGSILFVKGLDESDRGVERVINTIKLDLCNVYI